MSKINAGLSDEKLNSSIHDFSQRPGKLTNNITIQNDLSNNDIGVKQTSQLNNLLNQQNLIHNKSMIKPNNLEELSLNLGDKKQEILAKKRQD